MSQNLLDCPFCGRKPIFENCIIEAVIRCNSCRLIMTANHADGNVDTGIEEVIKTWNTRSQPSKGMVEKEYKPRQAVEVTPMQMKYLQGRCCSGHPNCIHNPHIPLTAPIHAPKEGSSACVIKNKDQEISALRNEITCLRESLSAKQDGLKPLVRQEVYDIWSKICNERDINPVSHEINEFIHKVISTFGTPPPSHVPSVEEILSVIKLCSLINQRTLRNQPLKNWKPY